MAPDRRVSSGVRGGTGRGWVEAAISSGHQRFLTAARAAGSRSGSAGTPPC
ncbi:hypothetical protein ACFFX0_24275 [Citricoccus parietis]|uniref:Uncharacterized protein n=1 Tax=Citricoccus parietis TaxID=592307 RepID=A0ABV5G5C5_9MICC